MFLNILTILKAFGDKLLRNKPVPAPKPAEETLDSAEWLSKLPHFEDICNLTEEDSARLGEYLYRINPPPRHPPEYYRKRFVPIKGGRRIGSWVECEWVPPDSDDEDHEKEGGCNGGRN